MKIAIHAGAAFTDEGRMMKLFKANAQTIDSCHGGVWGFRVYKRIFRPVLNAPQDQSAISLAREGFDELIAKKSGLERAVLCGMEYLGETPTTIMDGQFYPLAGQRLAALDRVFDADSVEVFIGLCNPGSFISRVLMSMPEADRQELIETTDLSGLTWMHLVDDIRDLAPNVKLTLWCNEDTPLIWGDIARLIAGLPEDAPLIEEYAFLSSLVSDLGKHEIQLLAKDTAHTDGATRRAALADVFRKHALADEIEQELDAPGWDWDVADAFTELYEQDVARLRDMPDIRFLKP